MAAVDIYLNETTRHADVILPPTTALERDQYDLVFHALAVRNTARFTPAVLPKPDGRTARLGDLPRDRAAHAGPAASRSRRWRRLLDRRVRLAAARRSSRAAAAHRPADDDAARCARTPRGSTSARCGRRCPTGCRRRDKRIDLAPGLVIDDLDRLRDALGRDLPRASSLLIGRRHQQDNNSWMHNTERLTRGKARHQLLMHPDDLAARGLDRRRAGHGDARGSAP